MFTYLVLEPSIFNGAHFIADPRYGEDVERILRAVRYNGCLLVDANDALLGRMLREMETIPPKYKQRVSILFTDLYLGIRGKKRVVTCATHLGNGHGGDATRIVAALLVSCGADAAVAPRSLHQCLSAEGAASGVLVEPAAYEASDAEARRESFVPPPALSNLSKEEVSDLFRRVLRFASWLRIYDRQIGRGGNARGFKEGIDFVLDQWTRHAHEPRTGARVEIVTAVNSAPLQTDTKQQKRETRRQNAEGILTAMRTIVDPLRAKYPFDVSLEVREDPEHEWHARFYETDIGVLKVDPGADLLKRSGAFKRVYLDHANQHSTDLALLYNLPRIEYAADGQWRSGT